MFTGEKSEAILRLLLAMISGGILGYERSSKRIDAGFRTHIIVCMSSCAIMITNIHTYLFYGTGDPMRMPAQVISGVGFLGAGCILVTAHQRIKGVTTAAGIWAAACLGLCIGAGDYIVAVLVMAMVLLTMTVLRNVDDRIVTKTKYMRLYMELESVSAITEFIKYLREQKARVTEMETIDNAVSDSIAIVISIRLERADSLTNVIARCEQLKGVIFASEL